MAKDNKLTFQFLAEPTDINFGGKVHGGAVMKWIDQVSFACASNWAGGYCVTVYVGGIRFHKPIQIGDLVKIEAKVIYTGKSSMHIMVDVMSKTVVGDQPFTKTTHCIIVFVSVDKDGAPQAVPEWIPTTENEIKLQEYALKLMNLRKDIEEEMAPFK
ncbi:MAG: acyl-CoA thioesterase [Saprospiraceae bacterium]|jgi:acyl-CoA hydrolase|nr:acyl-CoA thioesterase [Saprospiraceae bacterium]MBK6665742.1 acyl-CoA thioesterase [Saprospiraceae bacterium]MBK7700857.1 acyl-CoA thioesterase [Saprospiraceae bacterium]MBK8827865.1 acyl-CoA thioesterase [Saprospiraceae bacterium]MBK9581137.1 acyl-CoA thioesterase [Saprospiraceae bacterium]